MDLAELQRRVDRSTKLDLRPLYDAYRGRGGGDIEGFLAFLGAERAVDPSLLKEIHAMGDVETPTAHDSAYRGTLIAAWAKTAASPGRAALRGADDAPEVAVQSSDVRFQPISRLGEGAMGAIDIARDVYLRRKVALKTVLPDVASQPEVFDRFLAEMQITAQLEHPNIVPVYALDVREDGSLGYAMKLVQGQDLAALLDEARRLAEKGQPLPEQLTVEKRLDCFLKVCDALEYAHSKGIVHRDLKPGNIMIGRHNEVYLMDWGIARPMGAGRQALEAGFELPESGDMSSPDVGRTRVGSAVGTPSYMSPEQAAGKNPELDGQSDQYAMGLILQECFTLRTAVDGATVQEVYTKALMAKRDPVPVGSTPGALPREIDAIVRKATRREPGDRYPSIRELAEDVRRYVRGEAVSVLPEGSLRRAGRWLARHRMATLTLLLGIGLVGAGGTIAALVAGQSRLDAEHARELRVSQMAAESAIQAQLVDRQLTRFEAALTEFVGAAQIVLSKLPASDAAPYFEASFAAKETAPPDLAPSPRYGRPLSVLAPLTALGAGVEREPLDGLLRSLGLLGPAFRALLLDSSGADWRALPAPEQRRLIVDAGVPAYRATLALRERVTLSFPGMAGRRPAGPREAELLAEAPRGVVWGTPSMIDGEPILAASAPLHDERGAFRGVAVLEVALSRLLARPPSAELDYVQSRTLVGRDGKVMADGGKGTGDVPLAPEVAAAIAEGKSGTIVAEVNGRRYQYAFQPLTTVDWYYVSVGEVGKMMASKGKLVTSDPRKAVDAPVKAPRPQPSAPPPVVAPATPPEDAGAPVGEAADAGAAVRKLGPSPKPSADPSGEAPLPPNPFDKWKVYERKPKKP
jgi:serine/threonine-protein kinase